MILLQRVSLAAIEEVGVSIPVVVRLEGNNADIGSTILAESGAEIVSLNNLEDAANKSCGVKQMSILVR